MTIASRLRRLERGFGMRDCRECGGKGILVVSYHAEGEPAPIAKGCPACGACTHIVIDFQDESLPGRPAVDSGLNLTGAEMAALYA